ncbi:MAG: hypothetical protein VB014_10450 [Acidaminococcaceae bacterium]|nr:hypothetical protein [Acidaminococcaceae bacterium]
MIAVQECENKRSMIGDSEPLGGCLAKRRNKLLKLTMSKLPKSSSEKRAIGRS